VHVCVYVFVCLCVCVCVSGRSNRLHMCTYNAHICCSTECTHRHKQSHLVMWQTGSRLSCFIVTHACIMQLVHHAVNQSNPHHPEYSIGCSFPTAACVCVCVCVDASIRVSYCLCVNISIYVSYCCLCAIYDICLFHTCVHVCSFIDALRALYVCTLTLVFAFVIHMLMPYSSLLQTSAVHSMCVH